MSSQKSDESGMISTSVEIAENAVLAGAAETDECAGRAVEIKPMPPEILKKPVNQKSPAEWAYERLILYIQNFEQQIDTDEEVALGHVATGEGVLRVEGLAFFAPDLITFYGSDQAGRQTQLVQHVSQLSVVLRAMPKPDENKAAKRIGFDLGKALEGDATS